MDKNSVHYKEFLSHNIKFMNQLFTSEGECKDWNHIKKEFQITNNLHKLHNLLQIYTNFTRNS